MTPYPIKQETGAALITGLLILLLATFLAVASLENSNLQERMASNGQNTNIAFQAAESAIDLMINDAASTPPIIQNAYEQYYVATPVWPTDSYDSGNHDVSTGTLLRSNGPTYCEGNSLSVAASSAGCVSFEIEATSSIAGSGARSVIVQGFVKSF